MKFVYFGCWNQYNNIDIFEKIINDIMKKNISFISIGGDNYYPLDDKQFNIDRIENGFKLLPESKLKYIIFGNHDLESIDCLNYQLKLSNNSMIFYNGPIFKKEHKTIIVHLDTTIYTLDENINLPESYQLLDFSFNVKKVKNYIIKQEAHIIKYLKSIDFDKVIFIGHHPIFGAKNKKSNDRTYLINKLRDFIFSLGYNNIIYLSSHIHNYQKGYLEYKNKKILQYIAGTGGAFLDELPKNNNFVEDNTNYNILDKKKEYGYLNINDDKIIFQSIKK